MVPLKFETFWPTTSISVIGVHTSLQKKRGVHGAGTGHYGQYEALTVGVVALPKNPIYFQPCIEIVILALYTAYERHRVTDTLRMQP